MARNRTELGPNVEARILSGVKRGETAAQVSAALGGVVSRATVGRRMREVRGPVAAPRVSVASKPAPSAAQVAVDEVPEEVPEDTPLGQIDAWLALVDEAIDKVGPGSADENLPLFGQLIARASALSETRRKATPPERADPNDSPDMVALRAEAARKWHEMIDLVAEGPT